MLRIFCGYDPREREGFNVFVRSLIERSRDPISVTALTGHQRDGTNAFTYSRFLVPYLCNYQGRAIWVDGSDMLLRADISKLVEHFELGRAVSVVKHEYKTRHPRKYVGTEMEAENSDYEKKNWSSVILWDCRHSANEVLTPEYIEKSSGAHLHRFEWLRPERIGSLPIEWNWLVDEYGPNDEAKLLHWTAGIPWFERYRNAPHAEEWRKMRG